MSKLSPKSFAVLSLIAEGYSYSQIVDGHSEITYLDIFYAAEEALRLNENESDYRARLAGIKSKYPRAYEKWAAEEDSELRTMFTTGVNIAQLAVHFQRQPSAIRSRINKLGLVSSSEQSRNDI